MAIDWVGLSIVYRATISVCTAYYQLNNSRVVLFYYYVVLKMEVLLKTYLVNSKTHEAIYL